MATDREVELVLRYANAFDPMQMARHFHGVQAGVGAVLRYLNEVQGTATAGKISSFLNVSTARVAALLKKMEAKGLITREPDIIDARVTVVRLTNTGRTTIEGKKEELYREVRMVIDQIGMERLRECFATLNEIKKIVKGPDFDV